MNKTLKEIYALTNRSYSQYLDHLHIPETFLKGKRILDVGSGLSDFAETVNETLGSNDKNTRAVAMDINYDIIDDPDFVKLLDERGGYPENQSGLSYDENGRFYHSRVRQIIEKKTKRPDLFVIGDRKNLLFRDAEFDLIIYHNSIYPALNHEENNPLVMQILKEGIRVIDVNGQIRIVPTGLGVYYGIPIERLSSFENFVVIRQRDFNEKRGSFINPEMLEFFKQLGKAGLHLYVVQDYNEEAKEPDEKWLCGTLIITKGEHQFSGDEILPDEGGKGRVRVMKLELEAGDTNNCIVPVTQIYTNTNDL